MAKGGDVSNSPVVRRTISLRSKEPGSLQNGPRYSGTVNGFDLLGLLIMLSVMVAWFGSGIHYMRSIPFERCVNAPGRAWTYDLTCVTRIFDPSDSDGNVCGRTQPSLDLSRRPLLLYVPLLNGSTLALCVAACPEADVLGSGAVQDIFLQFCSYDANDTETYSELVAKGQCPIAVQRSVDGATLQYAVLLI